MKKLLALMLALVMVLALTACGGNNAAPAPAEAPAAPAEAPAEPAEAPAAPAEEPAAAGDTYKVGICQLVEHPALDAASQGFMDALTEKLGDSIAFDYQTAQGESANCVTIVNGFVADDVDLILANATPALQAAAAATADIPILGTAVTSYSVALDVPDEDWTGASGTNISGTSDLPPLDEQANMLATWFPVDEYPTVGVLYCSAEANSVYQVMMITKYLEEMGYTVNPYVFNDSNDVASVTQNACDACDVLYIPTDNTAASNTAAIDNVARPAGVPIIAGEEGICESCGVASLTISYYDLGYTTGQMAYEILVNGADVSTMQIGYAPVTPKYNPDICGEFGLEAPDGYIAIGE